MSQKWSVKSLVAYLKMKLDNDFLIQNITVVGEISNFNYHNNRHMYFTLKDETSRISCVMFSSSASRVKFLPKNGMKVALTASVSIFESSGSLQLYVSEMIEDGVGDLALKFELLKKQLANEGLFNEEHKKPFKKYPNSIAVVSGKDSAALNDILTTLKRRWPIAKVDVYTSLVQGNEAHFDIINKLDTIDQLDYDSIILARGGGSIEDLWAFNEEELARKIFSLKTPIISGVGHEIDFTISDFVSDLRAATPTAAAELITPNINEVSNYFANIKNTLIERAQTISNNNNQILYTLANHPVFIHPELLYSNYVKDLQKNKDLLLNFKDQELKKISNFNNLSNELLKHVSSTINSEKIRLNTLDNSIISSINSYMQNVKSNFATQLSLLDSYSPINTLKRGYSIIESNEKVVTNIKELQINSIIKIKMSDGSINAKVLDKENSYE